MNAQASVLSLLEIFGLQDPGQSLHTHSVNGLQNVITLESRLQMRFDNFELWLEPVGGQVFLIALTVASYKINGIML